MVIVLCVCMLSLQDLQLAMESAGSTKALTPMGGMATQLYQLLCEQGHAEKDFTVMFQFLQKKST